MCLVKFQRRVKFYADFCFLVLNPEHKFEASEILKYSSGPSSRCENPATQQPTSLSTYRSVLLASLKPRLGTESFNETFEATGTAQAAAAPSSLKVCLPLVHFNCGGQAGQVADHKIL